MTEKFTVKCPGTESQNSVEAFIEPTILNDLMNLDLTNFPEVVVASKPSLGDQKAFGRIVVRSKRNPLESVEVPLVLAGK